MKYIKTFEDLTVQDLFVMEPKYKIGDYIKIIDNRIKEWARQILATADSPYGYKVFKFAKIIGDNPDDDFFNIKFEIIANDKLNFLCDNKNIIERKLTPKEIEEFEYKKSILKYNL